MNLHMLISSTEFVIDALQILAAITCVLIVALPISLAFRRRPAARHAVWLGSLVCVLAAPVVIPVFRNAGYRSVTLPITTLHIDSATSKSTTVHGNFGVGKDEKTSVGISPLRKENSGEKPIAALSDAPESAVLETQQPPQIEERAKSEDAAHGEQPVRGRFQTWWTLLAAIWLTGSVCLFGRLLYGLVHLRRTARGLAPFNSQILTAQLAQISCAMRMREMPKVATSADVGGPLVIGLVRPRIVLPTWLVDRVPQRQLVDVLVHECAHVARHDQWIVPLQRLTEILFWPHPLVHVMNRELNQAREEVCDNYVLAESSPPDFAETLLNIATHCRPPRMLESLAMIGRRSALEGRVRFLLDSRRVRATRVSALGRWLLYSLLLVILACVAMLRTQTTAADEPAVNPAEAVAVAPPEADEPNLDKKRDVQKPKQKLLNNEPRERVQPRDGKHVDVKAKADPKVAAAVKAASNYLVSQQKDSGAWISSAGIRYTNGVTSLALLALIKSGMTLEDKPVALGLAYLRQLPQTEPSSTYDRSLVLSALAAAKDGKRDERYIQQLVQKLEESQLTKGASNGAWSYPLPSVELYDHSNSQFAVVALRDAADYGVTVNRQVWERILGHWLKTQSTDGGWNYVGDGNPSTGSMTAAGISVLLIADRMLHDAKARGKQGEVRIDPTTDTALKRALKWMDDNFRATRNPGDQRWLLYYLHGIARAGRLSGRQHFGKHDWYQRGTDLLVIGQNARHGFWVETEIGGVDRDPIVGTSYGLLFLSNGKPLADK